MVIQKEVVILNTNSNISEFDNTNTKYTIKDQ